MNFQYRSLVASITILRKLFYKKQNLPYFFEDSSDLQEIPKDIPMYSSLPLHKYINTIIERWNTINNHESHLNLNTILPHSKIRSYLITSLDYRLKDTPNKHLVMTTNPSLSI